MLFANAEVEGQLQINDKTRLNCVKSFASTDNSAITILTIKPERSTAAAINIFNADTTLWYLDWQYSSFTCDVDSYNNKLDFSEGGTDLVATLTTGTYTLAQLATEIETQLNASGDFNYTCTYSADDQLTISANSVFDLMGLTGDNRAASILPHVGFYEDSLGKSSHNGDRTEYVIKKSTVTLGDGTVTVTKDSYIKLYSVAGDALLSDDSELQAHEPEILLYTKVGRNTFKNVHRAAQTNILDWLDQQGYQDINRKPFRKRHIQIIDEFRQWAKFETLYLIFEGLSNAVDDVFAQKAAKYKAFATAKSSRAVLRLDVNDDGKTETYETIGIQSGTVVTR